MSCGNNSELKLRAYSTDLAKSNQLRRLDIGGYHEMGNPTESEMGEVFEKYYQRLISGLVPLLRQ